MFLIICTLGIPIVAMSSCGGGNYQPFAIVVIPDTQYYSQSYPAIFSQQIQWILDNKTELNIQFVIHIGDVIETTRQVGTDEQIVAEWAVANTQLHRLDGIVPWLIAPGNHDYEDLVAADPPPCLPKEAEARNLAYFNTYFGVSSFSSYTWFGGNYPTGSMANSYGYFTVNDQEFLVMCLEFLPTDEDLAWAAGILDANTDKHIIIATHQYVTDFSVISDWKGGDYYSFETYNNPDDMWDELFTNYSNISLIVSGHFHVAPTAGDGDGAGRVVYYTGGEPINQCMAAYATPVEANGGNGYLRYYVFDLGNNQIDVYTYSPYMQTFKTDEENCFSLKFRKAGD